MTLHDAFRRQAASCRELGSPFMGRLLTLLAEHWPDDTTVARRLKRWDGDIGASGLSLPLRVAAGLHLLVLSEQDPELQAVYPPLSVDDQSLLAAVLRAIRRHDLFLCDWIESAPQTNEVRRSALLIATAHILSARHGLPLRLSELGASAGLNLMFDRYQLRIGDATWGPDDATVKLSPDWRGDPPPRAASQIIERRGVDLNPLRVGQPADELRLMSYVWPDQIDRLTRTRNAMKQFDAPVDKGDAIDWLSQRLASLSVGKLHLVCNTVAWQYFPEERQAKGRAIMEAAGAAATHEAPLAWFTMEGDPAYNRAVLTLRLWPGDISMSLGFAGFHGQWVEWRNPNFTSPVQTR
jgi:hypothetical protein